MNILALDTSTPHASIALQSGEASWQAELPNASKTSATLIPRCLEALRAKCQSYLGRASIGHPDRAALFVKAIEMDEEGGEETCYFNWMDPEIDDAADADVLPHIHAARARELVRYMFDEQALAYALAHGQDPRRIVAGTGRTLLECYEDCIDLGPGRNRHRAKPEDRERMQRSIDALREAQVRLSVESLTL